MNITDIRDCAEYFQEKYLETYYILTTYSGNCFILVGNKNNFAHLMGIEKNTYVSNGYSNANKLFNDIINGVSVNTNIIPNNISRTSKMYKKCLNFCKSNSLFWRNSGPISINYNPANSSRHLNNVSILISDMQTGYTMGWVEDSDININSESKLKKYCIATWIDESGNSTAQKEKYMPNQDIDLLKSIIALDKNSILVKEKKYTYDYTQRKNILQAIERNNSNLLIDNMHKRFYEEIAQQDPIHCKINGIQF
jgi:hypothetical protein